MELHQLEYRLHLVVAAITVLGMFSGLIFGLLLYKMFRHGVPSGVTTNRIVRIEVLEVPHDDDGNFMIPFSRVWVELINTCVIIKTYTVSVVSTNNVSVTYVKFKDDRSTKGILNGSMIMDHVGLVPESHCLMRVNSDGLVVESVETTYNAYLLDAVLIETRIYCHLNCLDMTLSGLEYRSIGTRYIFAPTLPFSRLYGVSAEEFTQIYLWNGTRYRMIDLAGNFIQTRTDFRVEICSDRLIGTNRQPTWKHPIKT